MQLRQLTPGAKFRIDFGEFGHADYKLLSINECRAYVEPLEKKKKKKQVRAADDTVLAEFDSAGRTSISPGTEVAMIDEELEDMLIMTTKSPSAKPPIKSAVKPSAPAKPPAAAKPQKPVSGKPGAQKTRSADRRFEPKAQERPVRPNTIRARLLAALESGKSDVPKLMKEFGMERSLLVAHIHEMWRCHGYGYSIVGDVAKIVRPTKILKKHAADDLL